MREFKEASVSWIGQIPVSWKEKKLKYLVRFASGGTPDKGNSDYWGGNIPWVSPKDMKSHVITDTEDHITPEGLAESATRMVEPNSMLIVVRSGILRHSIPVAVNKVPVALNQDMRALAPTSELDVAYLARLVEGHQRQLLAAWSKEGTTVESLEYELIAPTLVPIPPLSEQRAIADYLDRETARLDGLVAAKERVLGLLAEKRRALITRTVTRGLDPTVPLRDSGIPWLGKIPAHWRVERLRWNVIRLEQGWSPQAEAREPDENEWAVLKLNAVDSGKFDDSKSKALPTGIEAPGNLEVQVGDFLITRANTPELVGDVCYVERTRPQLILSDLIYRLDLDTRRLNGRYLNLFLLTPLGRSQIEADAHGSSASMVKISQEHIKNWVVLLPPIPEQHTIVAHIAKETAKLDALREATERTIGLLKERRAALIAEAVTGRINFEARTR